MARTGSASEKPDGGDDLSGTSGILVKDIIASVQSSLDVAHRESLRCHLFSVVKLDVSATFKFSLDESACDESREAASNPSGARHKLLRLFSRKPAASAEVLVGANGARRGDALSEMGEIRLDFQLLPKAMVQRQLHASEPDVSAGNGGNGVANGPDRPSLAPDPFGRPMSAPTTKAASQSHAAVDAKSAMPRFPPAADAFLASVGGGGAAAGGGPLPVPTNPFSLL